MSSNLVRAWKDEEYRESLSEAQRALLPENPAGSLELTDAELDLVAGAYGNKGGGGFNFCFLTKFFCGGSFICEAFSVCGFTIFGGI
jgi:mersacidin/lichenicidin family type 2 lantibiotic